MQTFLPYKSFQKTAECLDNTRLGKQRVEAYQILRILIDPSPLPGKKYRGWVHHPAVKMWQGHKWALREYGLIISAEYRIRGNEDTVYDKIFHLDQPKGDYPAWLGNNRLHESHRSNLLRKDFEFYSQFGWEESPGMPYYWPLPKS